MGLLPFDRVAVDVAFVLQRLLATGQRGARQADLAGELGVARARVGREFRENREVFSVEGQGFISGVKGNIGAGNRRRALETSGYLHETKPAEPVA